MGFNFFEPLAQVYGLLMKTMPLFSPFRTVYINKAVLTDINDTIALYFTTLISR